MVLCGAFPTSLRSSKNCNNGGIDFVDILEDGSGETSGIISDGSTIQKSKAAVEKSRLLAELSGARQDRTEAIVGAIGAISPRSDRRRKDVASPKGRKSPLKSPKSRKKSLSPNPKPKRLTSSNGGESPVASISKHKALFDAATESLASSDPYIGKEVMINETRVTIPERNMSDSFNSESGTSSQDRRYWHVAFQHQQLMQQHALQEQMDQQLLEHRNKLKKINLSSDHTTPRNANPSIRKRGLQQAGKFVYSSNPFSHAYSQHQQSQHHHLSHSYSSNFHDRPHCCHAPHSINGVPSQHSHNTLQQKHHLHNPTKKSVHQHPESQIHLHLSQQNQTQEKSKHLQLQLLQHQQQKKQEEKSKFCPLCSCLLTQLYQNSKNGQLTEIHGGPDSPPTKAQNSIPPYCVGCRAYLIFDWFEESKKKLLLGNLEKRLEDGLADEKHEGGAAVDCVGDSEGKGKGGDEERDPRGEDESRKDGSATENKSTKSDGRGPYDTNEQRNARIIVVEAHSPSASVGQMDSSAFFQYATTLESNYSGKDRYFNANEEVIDNPFSVDLSSITEPRFPRVLAGVPSQPYRRKGALSYDTPTSFEDFHLDHHEPNFPGHQSPQKNQNCAEVGGSSFFLGRDGHKDEELNVTAHDSAVGGDRSGVCGSADYGDYTCVEENPGGRNSINNLTNQATKSSEIDQYSIDRPNSGLSSQSNQSYGSQNNSVHSNQLKIESVGSHVPQNQSVESLDPQNQSVQFPENIKLATTSSEERTILHSYSMKKESAIDHIATRLAKGYELTATQCERCQMPMMSKDNEITCVVCPAIARKAKRIAKQKRSATSARYGGIPRQRKECSVSSGDEEMCEVPLGQELVANARTEHKQSGDHKKKSIGDKTYLHALEEGSHGHQSLPHNDPYVFNTSILHGSDDAPSVVNFDVSNHWNQHFSTGDAPSDEKTIQSWEDTKLCTMSIYINSNIKERRNSFSSFPSVDECIQQLEGSTIAAPSDERTWQALPNQDLKSRKSQNGGFVSDEPSNSDCEFLSGKYSEHLNQRDYWSHHTASHEGSVSSTSQNNFHSTCDGNRRPSGAEFSSSSKKNIALFRSPSNDRHTTTEFDGVEPNPSLSDTGSAHGLPPFESAWINESGRDDGETQGDLKDNTYIASGSIRGSIAANDDAVGRISPATSHYAFDSEIKRPISPNGRSNRDDDESFRVAKAVTPTSTRGPFAHPQVEGINSSRIEEERAFEPKEDVNMKRNIERKGQSRGFWLEEDRLNEHPVMNDRHDSSRNLEAYAVNRQGRDMNYSHGHDKERLRQDSARKNMTGVNGIKSTDGISDIHSDPITQRRICDDVINNDRSILEFPKEKSRQQFNDKVLFNTSGVTPKHKNHHNQFPGAISDRGYGVRQENFEHEFEDRMDGKVLSQKVFADTHKNIENDESSLPATRNSDNGLIRVTLSCQAQNDRMNEVDENDAPKSNVGCKNQQRDPFHEVSGIITPCGQMSLPRSCSNDVDDELQLQDHSGEPTSMPRPEFSRSKLYEERLNARPASLVKNNDEHTRKDNPSEMKGQLESYSSPQPSQYFPRLPTDGQLGDAQFRSEHHDVDGSSLHLNHSEQDSIESVTRCPRNLPPSEMIWSNNNGVDRVSHLATARGAIYCGECQHQGNHAGREGDVDLFQTHGVQSPRRELPGRRSQDNGQEHGKQIQTVYGKFDNVTENRAESHQLQQNQNFQDRVTPKQDQRQSHGPNYCTGESRQLQESQSEQDSEASDTRCPRNLPSFEMIWKRMSNENESNETMLPTQNHADGLGRTFQGNKEEIWYHAENTSARNHASGIFNERDSGVLASGGDATPEERIASTDGLKREQEEILPNIKVEKRIPYGPQFQAGLHHEFHQEIHHVDFEEERRPENQNISSKPSLSTDVCPIGLQGQWDDLHGDSNEMQVRSNYLANPGNSIRNTTPNDVGGRRELKNSTRQGQDRMNSILQFNDPMADDPSTIQGRDERSSTRNVWFSSNEPDSLRQNCSPRHIASNSNQFQPTDQSDLRNDANSAGGARRPQTPNHGGHCRKHKDAECRFDRLERRELAEIRQPYNDVNQSNPHRETEHTRSLEKQRSQHKEVMQMNTNHGNGETVLPSKQHVSEDSEDYREPKVSSPGRHGEANFVRNRPNVMQWKTNGDEMVQHEKCVVNDVVLGHGEPGNAHSYIHRIGDKDTSRHTLSPFPSDGDERYSHKTGVCRLDSSSRNRPLSDCCNNEIRLGPDVSAKQAPNTPESSRVLRFDVPVQHGKGSSPYKNTPRLMPVPNDRNSQNQYHVLSRSEIDRPVADGSVKNSADPPGLMVNDPFDYYSQYKPNTPKNFLHNSVTPKLKNNRSGHPRLSNNRSEWSPKKETTNYFSSPKRGKSPRNKGGPKRHAKNNLSTPTSRTSHDSSFHESKSIEEQEFVHVNIPSWVDDEMEASPNKATSWEESSVGKLLQKIDEIENDFGSVVASLPSSQDDPSFCLKNSKSDEGSLVGTKVTESYFSKKANDNQFSHSPILGAASFESNASEDSVVANIIHRMRKVQDYIIQQIDSLDDEEGSIEDIDSPGEMSDLIQRLTKAADSLRNL